MITIRQPKVTGIIIGVDTHKDEHVTVAVDKLGVRIGRGLPPQRVALFKLELPDF